MLLCFLFSNLRTQESPETNPPVHGNGVGLSPSYSKYEIRKRNPDPKTSALLVIDVQNYFSSMARPITSSPPSTSADAPPFPFSSRGTATNPPTTTACLKSGGTATPSSIDGTPEAELMGELDRTPGDVVVEKNTYRAFRNTRLEELLRERLLEEVIVTWVMTNLCCETTARDAFVRGFRVFFSTDATATSDKELHEATLKNMAYGFAYLVDCKRLQEGLFGNQ